MAVGPLKLMANDGPTWPRMLRIPKTALPNNARWPHIFINVRVWIQACCMDSIQSCVRVNDCANAMLFASKAVTEPARVKLQ